MNITIERVDNLLFLLKWEDSGVSELTEYSIYREGKLIDQITCTGVGSVPLTIGVGESPYVEVFVTGERLPVKAYPGHVDLNWLGVGGAKSYRIQILEGVVWRTVGTVLDNGLNAFTYHTDWLADSITHQFRMIPVDAANNLGTELEHDFLMVRHPDVPSVSYTYDSGTGKITVGAL